MKNGENKINKGKYIAYLYRLCMLIKKAVGDNICFFFIFYIRTFTVRRLSSSYSTANILILGYIFLNFHNFFGGTMSYEQ